MKRIPTGPLSRELELELRSRELGWMKARARDRRSWPSPAAWAQALQQLAGTALVRAQAQARIFGGGIHRELFALMEGVDRIAEERFFVVRDGDAVYVTGPRRGDDPRPAVIAKAAGLAEVGHSTLLAAADQQEKVIRRRRRSNRRGIELAERYIATLPKTVASPAKPRHASPRRRRPVRLFESCEEGCFVFMGEEGEPLEVDIEALLGDGLDGLDVRHQEWTDPVEAEVEQ